MYVFACLGVCEVQCCTVCVPRALSVHLLFADKGMQSASLLFPSGSDHALSLTVSSDFSRVAREGPEAAPLTSPASTS